MIATLLPLATGLLQLFNSVMAALEAARQRGEMTTAEEAQFDALTAETLASPAWEESIKAKG